MFPISRNPFYFQVYLFMPDSLLLLAHFYNCADYFFKYFEHSCLIFCNWQFWQLKSAGSKSVVHFFQLILMGRLTFQYAEQSWLWNDSLISSRILEDFLQRLLLLLLFTWADPGSVSSNWPPGQGLQNKAQYLTQAFRETLPRAFLPLLHWLLYLWVEGSWRLLLLLRDQRCLRKCVPESPLQSRNPTAVVCSVFPWLHCIDVSPNRLLLWLWVWVDWELGWDWDGKSEAMAITLRKLS